MVVVTVADALLIEKVSRIHRKVKLTGGMRMKDPELNVKELLALPAAHNLKLDQYRWLIKQVHECDAAKDKAFQTAFKSYWAYKKFDKDWQPLVFEAIEYAKSQEDPLFEEILRRLSIDDVQKSPASKILATLNPNYPAWDTRISKALGILEPEGKGLEAKILDAVVKYQNLQEWYRAFLASPEGKQVLEELSEARPEMDDLNPMKRIDILLWLLGSQRSNA